MIRPLPKTLPIPHPSRCHWRLDPRHLRCHAWSPHISDQSYAPAGPQASHQLNHHGDVLWRPGQRPPRWRRAALHTHLFCSSATSTSARPSPTPSSSAMFSLLACSPATDSQPRRRSTGRCHGESQSVAIAEHRCTLDVGLSDHLLLHCSPPV